VVHFERVPDEENQLVTVRRLPGGASRAASVQSLNGRLMWLSLDSFPVDPELRTGDLVEITSPLHLYLGEVVSARQAETIAVQVEHGLDRAALALIQNVWHSPAAD
jgi:hypothetical protein